MNNIKKTSSFVHEGGGDYDSDYGTFDGPSTHNQWVMTIISIWDVTCSLYFYFCFAIDDYNVLTSFFNQCWLKIRTIIET